MKNSKEGNVLVWVGVVVVVIGVVLFFVWKPTPGNTPGSNQNSGGNENNAAEGVPVHANVGSLTPQFPKDLILDTDATVSDSYVTKYSETTKQYTAAWTSSSSMTSLYNQYLAYLPQHGWTITNKTTKYSSVRSMYATNGTADLNIVINQADKGSEVLISYVVK